MGGDPLGVGTSSETYIFGQSYTQKKYSIDDFKQYLSQIKEFLHFEDLAISSNSIGLEVSKDQSESQKQNTAITNSRFTNSSQTTNTWQDKIKIISAKMDANQLFV